MQGAMAYGGVSMTDEQMSDYVRWHHDIECSLSFPDDMRRLSDLITYYRTEGMPVYADTLRRLKMYVEDYHWMGNV